MIPWTIFDGDGQRKYLTRAEVDAFVSAADARPIDVQTFCYVVAYTGCRISEALALTIGSIDFAAKIMVIRSLKKRGKRMFRAVPLSQGLLGLLRKRCDKAATRDERLWPWSRMTGYRRICEVMCAAGVVGSYASPKGLRHGFGVRAIQAQVPLNLVQRWLGHADIKTTAIYTSATGQEERAIAARMWAKDRAFDSRKTARQSRAGEPPQDDRATNAAAPGNGPKPPAAPDEIYYNSVAYKES